VTGEGPSSAAVAARPSPGTFQAASSHFIVHYENAGLASYAQEVSAAAELSWRVLVDTLLYNVPPSDGANGGDSRTDIYLRPSLGGAWGTTFFETQVGSPYVNSYTSWVEMVDTLSFDRRRAVTAHEIFHVVQVGYDANESVSFLEMISTWVEDRVYDDVNLYLEVLPFFFGQPTKGLYTFVYSNVPWMIFLTERYGDEILRDILEGCAGVPGVNVTAATDAALLPHGSSQIGEYQVFTLWNFFTGARDVGAHYSEGATFPLAYVDRSTDCIPLFDQPTTKMGRLGCAYVMFDGNGATDSLRLRFAPEWEAQSVVTVNRFQQGTVSTETRVYPMFTPSDSVTLSDWDECDSLLVVPQIETTSLSFNSFSFSAYYARTEPPPDPYVLVLDRDACRAPFDGAGDEFSARDGEEWPFVAALAGAGIRYVLSDAIPADLTLCGGVFVVGGHDGAGTNLAAGELSTLMAFMDGGGDVYFEGNEFGRWVATPTELSFWSYFGCSFTPGTLTGNVSAWSAPAAGPLGPFEFSYDFEDDPDASVGRLTPSAGDTLAVDPSGAVRMTILDDPSGSTRIMSTVLLGGSTGVTGTREGFIAAVVELFDSIVDALAVSRMRIVGDGTVVRIEGEVEGYAGETLRLSRSAGGALVEVPLSVVTRGSRTTLGAEDRPPAGGVVYRLEVVESGGGARLLWQEAYAVRPSALALSFVTVYPNPSSGEVTLVLESDRERAVTVGVYNVAGQRVLDARTRVAAGISSVALPGAARLGSGVYFVRVGAAGGLAQRKLHILR
jgi:hypothetical protein